MELYLFFKLLYVLLHCSTHIVERCKTMENIILVGQKVQLNTPTSEITNNLWLGLKAEFDIYQFAMNGHRLLLLVGRGSRNYSPMQLSNIADRIEKAVHHPAVFYFDSLPTYERDRLVDKGVYFVVSDKFTFIPTLLANRRLNNNEIPAQLLPSTQYLLLFHLQGCSLDGMTILDIASITPYKYATLAKSAQQLASLNLADYCENNSRKKRLSFRTDRRALWKKSQPYLSNPIKQSGYTNEALTAGLKGGIDALSHYSMLVGENIPTRVFTIAGSTELKNRLSQFEDIQRVEIWKYPPIAVDGYVDRLSLYLTLKDDADPRVQKELEIMINEMPW